MSADKLREAAALMRSRAKGAIYVYAEGHPKAGRQVPWFDAADAYSFDDTDGPHVMGMRPAVALAVADWLDDLYERITDTDYEDDDLAAALRGEIDITDWPDVHRALGVANAYLGGAS